MPIDPTLYPSMPNPLQRQIERTVNLEQRIAALEGRRDPVFTPMSSLQALNAFHLPWYGGRLWAVLAANGQAAGTASVTNTLLVNGVALPGGAGVLTITDGGAAWSASNMAAFQLPASALTLGDNILTMTTSGGTFGSFTGLFVEWPQA